MFKYATLQGENDSLMKHPRRLKWIAALGLLAAIALCIATVYWSRTPSREITRAELSALIQQKQIAEGKVTPTSYSGIYRVDGTLRTGGNTKKFFVTTHLDEPEIKALFALSAVKIEMPGQGMRGQWINIVSTLLIGGLVITLIVYQSNIGRAKNARLKKRPEIRFRDVAGIEEAKAEVQEIVDFLRHPKKYRRVGGTLPKGVLLIGPPGTGKTMLAKAIACEANASFFTAHGSDFNEVFVGVGAKRVRQLFRQASRNTPAIIFIDEIDCVGKNRKFDSHGEHQQTINALLSAMDGFQSSQGIVVVAATNRPEDLDEAAAVGSQLRKDGAPGQVRRRPIKHIEGLRHACLPLGKDNDPTSLDGGINTRLDAILGLLLVVNPAMDDVLLMGGAVVIVRRLGHGDESLRVKIRIDQQHPILRSLAGAVEGQTVQLLARVKAEDGLKSGELGLSFGLFHLRKQEFADGSRAQAVTINMQDPDWVGCDIGPLQRGGRGGEGGSKEAAGAEGASEEVHIHVFAVVIVSLRPGTSVPGFIRAYAKGTRRVTTFSEEPV